MDRFISTFVATEDADLRLCFANGVAYQADMSAGRIDYDESYHDHYKALEGQPVAAKLNAGRCALLARHAAPDSLVIDIGAGCGTFVRAARAWGFGAFGFDIIPKTVEVLTEMGAFASDVAAFDVVTFWDSLEHIEDPGVVLNEIRVGALVLVAIPLLSDLSLVRASKHFKPGEHLYHFTESGFVDWMGMHGFRLLEYSSHETDAGRESIGAFAFRRVAVGKPAPCPCGGDTFVDSFDWPKKPRQWFVRCEACRAMSDAAPTEAAAALLTIRPEQAAVPV